MALRKAGCWAAALTALTMAGFAAVSEAPLAEAARQRDWAAVRTLIEAKADPNAALVDESTALHWAVHYDQIEIARSLLRAGADVKAANRYGVTALSLACINGNGAMVELLLDAGADPNTALPGGETALMTASRTGRVEAVKALLARGADVNAKESLRGQTAIMWAAAEGHVETVEALMAAGANYRERLDTGYTPFLFAVREGRTGVVRTLLKAGVDVNEKIEIAPERARRPIHGAPRPGSTALHLAVGNAHYELAAMLLEAGADPNANEPGYTPLHVVTWIRKPGVGDNDPAPEGSGEMTSIEFVKKLKEHGADLNARMTKRIGVGLTRLNTVGATTFLLAARTGDAELMRELAALGADPLLPNADNSTPLIVAAGLGTRSPGEDAGTEEEVVEAVKAALELGNDIDAVDDNGETAMHGAAYKNLPRVVEVLAEYGADIKVWHQKNRFGWTPLSIAEGYRFGNYKPSPVTVEALRKVMRAAGVEPVSDPDVRNRTIY
ncbi:MAG: ankyrin repeat domain-containing protein [Bryobacteraceae bacterium]